MSSPRKSKILSTKYFDIIFPEESLRTATILGENGDDLFDKAVETCGGSNIKAFRMPVVVSPDSDELSVTYSQSPYNRIVIYEGVPDVSYACYDDVLLSLFYHEVLYAVRCSIRSPFNQFLATFFTMYQPVSIINAPVSLIDASINLDESDDFFGRLNDQYYLEILIQAKIENKFPTWFQAFTKRDIYPGEDLTLAANTAFLAYIQQKWGFQKYIEFWQECGKLHYLLTPGIFKKVYGVTLESAWNDFKDSILLPDHMDEIIQRENLSESLIKNDEEGLYEFTLNSKYGLVWYDAIRHEVDIYDSESPLKIRQLLFLAENVTNMTLAPDGRFMTISYIQEKNRENFKQNITLIYDLKKRVFVSDEFYCRDACLVVLSDETYGLAGIDVSEKHSKLVIYNAAELNNYIGEEKEDLYGTEYVKQKKELVYTRDFDFSVTPSSPNFAGTGKLLCLVENQNDWKLMQIDFNSGEEKLYELVDEDYESIKIKDLRFEKNRYTFHYKPDYENCFTRTGYIQISAEGDLNNVFLQRDDLLGGVNYPVFDRDKIYYVSKKVSHNELRSIPEWAVSFSHANLVESDMEVLVFAGDNIPEIKKKKLDSGKKVIQAGEYTLKSYNPFSYMFEGIGAFVPFIAIRDISFENGAENWPALGLSFYTHSDPFLNNEVQISGAYQFIENSYTTSINLSEDLLSEEIQNSQKDSKNITIGALVSNYSTPVDIKAGGLFKFNQSGSYDIKAFAGTSWKIPLRMRFRKLLFDVKSELSYSTDYYDVNRIETHPSLSDWPNISNVYSFFRLSTNLEYTNVSQYGISPFEKRGITVGTTLYTFWDTYEIQKAQKDKQENQITEVSDTNDQYNVQALYADFVNQITQFNLSVYAKVEIPRLTPLQMYDGWVLSVPSSVSLALMNETGKALQSTVELLLIGKEIQNGIPQIALYFSRIGLNFGYDMNLLYDTNVMSLPDIRQIARFTDIFMNTYYDDNLYLKLNMDFLIPIGRLSSNVISNMFKIAYYPRQQGFKFDVSFNAKF